jgi:predicted AAA+ superfamily ATPase
MVYSRIYQQLSQYLESNRALIIYGPRRVGKTTLLQNFLSQTPLKYKLDSGDNIKVQNILSSQDFDQIIPYVQGYDIYAIDEAQRVPNIGQGLKIIVDQIPNIKVIATGSSSFALSGQIGEPLTGRKNTLTLYPLSQIELRLLYNQFELKQNLSQVLIYGSYPSVLSASPEKQIAELEEIVNSYLLKDILELERVKGSKVLLDLLRLIAYQIGGEVSLSELGQQLGIDTKTVARYLDLLEKSFIVYNLRGYSRNLRSEITKKSKYYFLDNGIRNTIISNFNTLGTRNDLGQLWENFLVGERLKAQHYKNIHANNYFWRTWDKQEIDWIEEREGKLFASEFKYSQKGKHKIPKMFTATYPESSSQIITPDNFLDFVIPS